MNITETSPHNSAIDAFMTLSGAPATRSPFRKAYSSFVALSCCSRRAPRDVLKRHSSTISEMKPPTRPHLQEGQRDLLLYLLRPHVAKERMLDQREDTFVSVKDLLNHPEFRHLDIGALQELADRDKNHNLIIKYDANDGQDHWWVRSKAWNEYHTVRRPISLHFRQPDDVIFVTTLREWDDHISRIGIPKPRDEDIKLECKIKGPPLAMEDGTAVYIHLNLNWALRSGIKFYSRSALPDKSVPSHIYTSGNQYGFIPPQAFSKVDIVRVKQTLLWGNPEPLQPPHVIKQDAKSYQMEWKQLRPSHQNLGSAQVKTQTHGKTIEEACLAVN